MKHLILLALMILPIQNAAARELDLSMPVNIQVSASIGYDSFVAPIDSMWATVWIGTCVEIVPGVCLGVRLAHASNPEIADINAGINSIDLYFLLTKQVGKL